MLKFFYNEITELNIKLKVQPHLNLRNVRPPLLFYFTYLFSFKSGLSMSLLLPFVFVHLGAHVRRSLSIKKAATGLQQGACDINVMVRKASYHDLK
jgi:hypothetical protein